MREGYLVKTTLGDGLLSSNDEVYVKTSPRSYVKKRASDVNEGDMVVYKKPFTVTHLEDVEPHLTKSPRYAKAKDLIHEQNSRGDYIPRLRVLLLEGLADHGVIDPTDLREKALYETDDFSDEEYRTMETYLAPILDSADVPLSTAAIRNWLTGDTTAPIPSNWKAFRALEREVNPTFSEFVPYADEPDSMYFNYRLFMTIRRGIMRKLNHFRGTSMPGPEHEERSDSKISLAPEFAIVAQHFLTDESEKYATGRVIRSKRVNRKQIKRERDINIRLVDGIETDRVEAFEGSLKTYADIFDDHDMLEYFFYAAIEEYLQHCRILPTIQTPHEDFVVETTVFLMPRLYRLFGESLDPEMIGLDEQRKQLEKKGSPFSKHVATVENNILLGGMDSTLLLERGRMLTLLESMYRVRRSLPKVAHKFLASAGKDQKARKKVENLGLTPGDKVINPRKAFLSEVLKITSPPKPGTANLRTMREYLKQSRVTEGAIRQAKNFADEHGFPLRSRDETMSVLEEYRLEDLIFLREADFSWESQYIV